MAKKTYKRSELEATITGNKDILRQNDWIARKVLFELCAKFKEAYPDIELPIYEKYKGVEDQANILRQEINDCEEKLPNAEDDLIMDTYSGIA